MKVRTILTTFGVVIGTSAIVTMVSIGAGMHKNVSEQLMSMGSATEISVMPRYDFASTSQSFEELEPLVPLDNKALQKINRLDSVIGVTPILSIPDIEMKVDRYVSRVSIMGIEPSYNQKSIKIKIGRAFRAGDKNVALIGYKVGEILEEGSKRGNVVRKLGKSIQKIKTEEKTGLSNDKKKSNIDLFRKTIVLKANKTNLHGQLTEKLMKVNVVGVLDETGQHEDNVVIIPVDMAKDLKKWSEGSNNKDFSFEIVRVQIDSPQKIESVQREIEALGFDTFSMKQMLESVNKIFGIIEVLSGVIGSIALFVASFGIVNTMIMSIYERTKEIGIMKVIGATVEDIKKIFLFEAGIIGLMGGLIGLGSSWIGSRLINLVSNIYFGKGTGETVELVYVPLWLAIFAVLFSTTIGLLAGIYPSVRAARLSPMEAMRQ